MAEADPQTTFNVHEAKTHLSKLIDRAHAGEEIVIAKAGEPWAKMVPVTPPTARKRQPGGLKLTGPFDLAAFLEPLPEEDLAFIDDRPEVERH
ncbi:MAG: type II toxin-antitoxin system prevent-host-death family antitoxin [Pseudomonadota bacterium]